MRKIVTVLIVGMLLGACANEPSVSEPNAREQKVSEPKAANLNFDAAVKGKEWKLAQVLVGQQDIGFSREGLAAENFGDIFVLKFDERVTGVAAPNRFFAPDSVTGQTLEISAVAGTLMAALREPEKLKEREFLSFLEKAHSWDVKDGDLWILTRNEAGNEAVLIFKAS
jgi:heat shock protein HslJ